MSKRLMVGFSALVLAGSLALSSPARAEGWESEIGFYGWFCGLDGTISAGQVSDAPVSATFSDLVGYLDFAGAGYFEARKPKYVFQTDISYVGLERHARPKSTAPSSTSTWTSPSGSSRSVAPIA